MSYWQRLTNRDPPSISPKFHRMIDYPENTLAFKNILLVMCLGILGLASKYKSAPWKAMIIFINFKNHRLTSSSSQFLVFPSRNVIRVKFLKYQVSWITFRYDRLISRNFVDFVFFCCLKYFRKFNHQIYKNWFRKMNCCSRTIIDGKPSDSINAVSSY